MDCLRLHVIEIRPWWLNRIGKNHLEAGSPGVGQDPRRAIGHPSPSFCFAILDMGLWSLCLQEDMVPFGITCAFQAAKIGQTKEKRRVPDEALFFFEIVIVFPKTPPGRQFSLINQN